MQGCIKNQNHEKEFIPLEKLTNEQLCERFQSGEIRALEVLLQKNERLIYSRVRKYVNLHRHKLDVEDLVSYGKEGMMIAAKKYDLERRNRFTTYCTFWIDQKIVRGIHDCGFTIRFPVHLFEVLRKIARIEIENPLLTEEELIQKIVNEEGMVRSKVQQVIALKSHLLQVPSLNVRMTTESETEIQDAIADEESLSPEERVMKSELREVLAEVLGTLTDKEQFVIINRFGLEDNTVKTLEEVGQILGVTRERVRQIELKALRKLGHPTRRKQLAEFIDKRTDTYKNQYSM